MASRVPGRRRAPGHWRPAGRPSLLMLDYLETGLFRGRPDAAPSPSRRRRSRGGAASGAAPSPLGHPRSPGRTASGVRRLLADGRVLAVAAVVAVALAVLAGTSVPLRSTQAGPARPPVAPSPVNPGGAPQ